MEGSGHGLIKGIILALPGGTKENHDKPVRIAGLQAEI
jgi:hypothetical protein